MQYSTLEIAAFATVLMPHASFDAVQKVRSATSAAEIVLVKDDGTRLLATLAKKDSADASKLLRDTENLRELNKHIRENILAFSIPKVIVSGELGDVIMTIYTCPLGKAIRFVDLSDIQARSIGTAIASLHSFDTSLLSELMLDRIDAQQVRRQAITELDEMNTTGLLSEYLYKHFMDSLEETDMFKFTTLLSHNALRDSAVLFNGDAVNYVVNFSRLCVQDPATDLASVSGYLFQDYKTELFEAYRKARNVEDIYLEKRTKFYEEFNLVRWFLNRYRSGNQDQISTGVQALAGLEDNIQRLKEYEKGSRLHQFSILQDMLPTIKIDSADASALSDIETQAVDAEAVANRGS
ncbi:MAG: phosphotransferase [Bifidobacteriaceae bacterium]|jgi:hypothetical protein|nr:phosphotransferase [Bifidobacteriaceae bacterium]